MVGRKEGKEDESEGGNDKATIEVSTRGNIHLFNIH
jgi:hypothetical protein